MSQVNVKDDFNVDNFRISSGIDLSKIVVNLYQCLRNEKKFKT